MSVEFLEALLEADRQRGERMARMAEHKHLQGCAQRRCGNCDFWMKSSLCPSERNINGMSRGPSGDGAPCSKFKSSARHSEWMAKLSAFEAQLVR